MTSAVCQSRSFLPHSSQNHQCLQWATRTFVGSGGWIGQNSENRVQVICRVSLPCTTHRRQLTLCQGRPLTPWFIPLSKHVMSTWLPQCAGHCSTSLFLFHPPRCWGDQPSWVVGRGLHPANCLPWVIWDASTVDPPSGLWAPQMFHAAHIHTTKQTARTSISSAQAALAQDWENKPEHFRMPPLGKEEGGSWHSSWLCRLKSSMEF
jgi:hypothetical protein